MKIEKTEFSFEQSLKYLDELNQHLRDKEDYPEFHSIEVEALPTAKVAKVYCSIMYIEILRASKEEGKEKEYAYSGTVSLILKLLQSAEGLLHLDLQTDGSIMALFNTPMKKDVEELVILAAQVRSVNDVALTKFQIGLDKQVVSVGMDYGPVSCFVTGHSAIDPIYRGPSMTWAKNMASRHVGHVNISNDIYINLSDDMQQNLFVNHDEYEGLPCHYSPLINIKMDKWVKEQQKK